MAVVAVFMPLGQGMIYFLRPEPVLFTQGKPAQTGILKPLRRKPMFQQFKTYASNLIGKYAAPVAFVTGAGIASAQAAVPADVTTAITTAGTDATTVATASLVVFVGIKTFKWIRRAL